MTKYKNNFGVRTRINGDVVELWLGEPGDAEADLIACFHKDYLHSVMHQLEALHKAPTVNNGTYYAIKRLGGK